MTSKTLNHDDQENLLDELHVLLEKQVQMLKNSNFRELEVLTDQTNCVVAEITQTTPPLTAKCKKQGEQITYLYKKLELIVETEKDNISRKLRKITGGKKTIRAYQQKT